MNKVELLVDLAGRFDVIGQESLQPASEANVNIYQVSAYWILGDVIKRESISFAVIDEGQSGEAAYWITREPLQPQPRTGFVGDVEAFIDAKIVDGILNAAFIEHYNETRETAIVVVYRIEQSVLVKKEAVVYRDSQGDIAFRVLGA